MYTYKFVCAHALTHTHAHARTHTPTRPDMPIHAYMKIYVYNVYVYKRIHIHVLLILNVYKCVHIYISLILNESVEKGDRAEERYWHAFWRAVRWTSWPRARSYTQGVCVIATVCACVWKRERKSDRERKRRTVSYAQAVRLCERVCAWNRVCACVCMHVWESERKSVDTWCLMFVIHTLAFSQKNTRMPR